MSGWKSGKVEANGRLYDYSAKVYDEGGAYGIDGGRISKLCIKRAEDECWNRPVASYDREWDVEPADADAEAALEAVKAIYR